MNDALRSLRLGTVSLFGVAVPGFVLISLAAVGLLMPALAIALHLSDVSWDTVAGFVHADRWLVAAGVVVLSYVAGYILRLTSPDDLDKISMDHVLVKLSDKERAVWPCRGDGEDKFPYFHFKSYLKARGHKDLVDHVRWGPDDDEGTTKRSKTVVHKMKLDVLLAKPELADIVDSNEAHIRLMAGTWLAVGTATGLLVAGAAVAIAGLVLVHSPFVLRFLGLSGVGVPPYAAFLVLNLFLLASGKWATKRIESLFHYRRVNELVFITMAANEARKTLPNTYEASSCQEGK